MHQSAIILFSYEGGAISDEFKYVVREHYIFCYNPHFLSDSIYFKISLAILPPNSVIYHVNVHVRDSPNILKT